MARIADQKTIGLRIAKVRNDMNMSQERFAEVLDISRNTMGSIERGETAPSLSALTLLFERTNMTPSRLFFITEIHSVVDHVTNLVAEMTTTEREGFLQAVKYLAYGIVAEKKVSPKMSITERPIL